ncbi:MAG: N-acetyl-gamma-glutamyl-phosphate reductase [Pseudomonadota bacterium]
MRPKVFIDGEHGTTGLQIRTRLARRDDLEVISIPQAERRNEAMRRDHLNSADIAVLCLPDAASRQALEMLEGSNSTRIIDTSSAHRTNPDWAYGFAEMDESQADTISQARRVANPGCYPTGAIALIRPLRLDGVMPSDYPVTINAVSGYTGGGKKLIAQMEDESNADHIDSQHFVYGLSLNHKHVPEIQKYALLEREPLFSPSVSRFAQGMVVQVPLHLDMLNASPTFADIHAVLSDHYAGQQVVQVAPVDEADQLQRICAQALSGTNDMRLFVCGSPGGAHVNLVAVLDNLGKGASGAAVQNMDLMLAS